MKIYIEWNKPRRYYGIRFSQGELLFSHTAHP